MAMFTAHIAFILAVFAVAAGLIALHYAQKLKAKLINCAGMLLVVFGASGIFCAGYYAIQYLRMGHYKHAYDFNITLEGNGPHYHCSGSVGD
jgi:hypothetical protein